MPLTPEEWFQVKEIVASAVELKPQDRLDFIEAASAGNSSVLQEVHSLLAYETRRQRSDFTAPLPVELVPGQILNGRYRIAQLLATGGFSKTYIAYDIELHNRRVVVKLLNEYSTDPYIRRKFQEEIVALSKLQHPNIVAPLGSGHLETGTPFLVMQFADGETLRALLSNGGLPPARAASLLRQIGKALAAVHREGIFHRDLKPENIIVQPLSDSSDHVLLLDFGIASVTGPGLQVERTRVIGTAAYMAPEQFLGEVSAATDIYAFGVVAYEILTGELPPNPRALGNVPALQQETGILIGQALSIAPADRPDNAAVFADRLAASLFAVAAEDKLRPATRPSIGLALVVVLGLVLLLMLVLTLVQRSTTREHKLLPSQQAGSHAVPLPAAAKLVPALTVRLETRLKNQDAAVDPAGSFVKPSANLSAEAAAEPLHLPADASFRFVVTTRGSGHVYLFAESSEATPLHILFPSPTARGGQSRVNAGEPVSIPEQSWLAFGSQPGHEKVWFAWSSERDSRLESAGKWANPVDRGEVRSIQDAAAVRASLGLGQPFQRDGLVWEMFGSEPVISGFIDILH